MELKKYPIGFHFLHHKENFENSNGSSTLLRAVQFYVIILTLFETCEGVNHQKKIIHIRNFLGGAESELFFLFIAGKSLHRQFFSTETFETPAKFLLIGKLLAQIDLEKFLPFVSFSGLRRDQIIKS